MHHQPNGVPLFLISSFSSPQIVAGSKHSFGKLITSPEPPATGEEEKWERERERERKGVRWKEEVSARSDNVKRKDTKPPKKAWQANSKACACARASACASIQSLCTDDTPPDLT